MVDFVTVYLPESIPTLDWLSQCPGVTKVEGKGRDAKQFEVTFLDMGVRINVMPREELKSHLEGFANYVISLHLKKQDDATFSVLERISATKNVLGCVIEPSLDNEGLMGGFITTIAQHGKALVFARDCIFDSDGTQLLGPHSGP